MDMVCAANTSTKATNHESRSTFEKSVATVFAGAGATLTSGSAPAGLAGTNLSTNRNSSRYSELAPQNKPTNDQRCSVSAASAGPTVQDKAKHIRNVFM